MVRERERERERRSEAWCFRGSGVVRAGKEKLCVWCVFYGVVWGAGRGENRQMVRCSGRNIRRN